MLLVTDAADTGADLLVATLPEGLSQANRRRPRGWLRWHPNARRDRAECDQDPSSRALAKKVAICALVSELSGQ